MGAQGWQELERGGSEGAYFELGLLYEYHILRHTLNGGACSNRGKKVSRQVAQESPQACLLSFLLSFLSILDGNGWWASSAVLPLGCQTPHWLPHPEAICLTPRGWRTWGDV